MPFFGNHGAFSRAGSWTPRCDCSGNRNGKTSVALVYFIEVFQWKCVKEVRCLRNQPSRNMKNTNNSNSNRRNRWMEYAKKQKTGPTRRTCVCCEFLRFLRNFWESLTPHCRTQGKFLEILRSVFPLYSSYLITISVGSILSVAASMSSLQNLQHEKMVWISKPRTVRDDSILSQNLYGGGTWVSTRYFQSGKKSFMPPSDRFELITCSKEYPLMLRADWDILFLRVEVHDKRLPIAAYFSGSSPLTQFQNIRCCSTQ